jgi:hypothetical protein
MHRQYDICSMNSSFCRALFFSARTRGSHLVAMQPSLKGPHTGSSPFDRDKTRTPDTLASRKHATQKESEKEKKFW